MRVLVAAPLYPPHIGGPATYVKMIEAELPKHGVELTVVAYSSFSKYPKGISHLLFFLKLLRATPGHDLLYGLDAAIIGFISYITSKLRRLPLLVRVPGDYAWEQGQLRFGVTESLDDFVISAKRQPLFVGLLKNIQRRVCRGAVRIIVPSEYMKGIVQKWGVNEADIVRIYSVLHAVPVGELPEVVASKVNQDSLVVNTAARLVPLKGIGPLIELLPQLMKRYEDLIFVITGDGPLREELESKARQLQVSGQVVFTGNLAKDALGAVISRADVFVLNSSYEGMSHQLLEAISLGTPVVVTDVGGNSELITNEVNGLLVPYGNRQALYDAIVRLLDSKPLAKRLSTEARKSLTRFDQESGIRELVSIMSSI